MNILKRGGIAALSLVIMLVIAGYVNYKYDPTREENLGKTIYVNGKDSFTYDSVSIYDESSISTEDESNNINEQANSDDSIAVFRYDRDNMYSELMENYKVAISNSNISKEKIDEYQSKLNEIVEEKNLINMVENVILSKGIDDIVIIPTGNDNVNVVIKSKEKIEDDMIAKIQQVIIDQLGVEASKISIECKN